MVTTVNGLRRGKELRFTTFNGIDTSLLLVELILPGSWNRTMTLDDFAVAVGPLISNISHTIREIEADAQMDILDSAVFSTGANEFTLIDPSTTDDPIQLKSRSGNFTITNPFGNVIIPSATASSVILTTTQSVILWPTTLGWEYNG